THNVVASLWKVPDESKAALMALFYRNLWEKQQPPLEALRQAQREIYRHPGKIPELAKSFRGKFEEVSGTGGEVVRFSPRMTESHRGYRHGVLIWPSIVTASRCMVYCTASDPVTVRYALVTRLVFKILATERWCRRRGNQHGNSPCSVRNCLGRQSG